MPTFTAHRLSSDNTLFPDRLEIDTVRITYYKGFVFGYQSIIIARNNIASVSIGSRIFFADVVIEIIGGKRIVASGFKKSDVKTIVNSLNIF
ncbi:hypothetical protein AGMMS49574_25080 [Bacteroidia bacterium]|nr:hypothetical protein AGMMS49574_25080 [Bacteroidia bacterium]